MYEYFYGNKVSDYGLKNGYVDYSTLAKSFNHVLANQFMSECGLPFDIISGNCYNEEEDAFVEIFQYYIIDEGGAKILEDADEIVFYCEELDLYVWGVTHWGTSWDYVLTNIPLKDKF